MLGTEVGALRYVGIGFVPVRDEWCEGRGSGIKENFVGHALRSSGVRAPPRVRRAVSGRRRKVPDSSSLTSRAPPSAGTAQRRSSDH